MEKILTSSPADKRYTVAFSLGNFPPSLSYFLFSGIEWPGLFFPLRVVLDLWEFPELSLSSGKIYLV